MELVLTEMCAKTRNYFIEPSDIHLGAYTVSGSTLAPLDFLKEGQYFCIKGSTFNDGVHKYPANDLVDEVFDGAVWAMRIPPAFIALETEISAYKEKIEQTPYVSESFGNYSYTKATDESGKPIAWDKVFAPQLNQYRKAKIV